MSGYITKYVEVPNETTVSFKDRGLKLETASDAEPVVSEIRACENLCTLCLSGNTIGVDAARAIAGALKEKPTLRRALWSDIFTGRLRSEIPLALEALGDAVSSSGAVLTELDLSDNAFGPDGVRACTSLLTSDAGRSIQVLKFHNNGLSSAGGEILAKALESSRSTALSERAALKVIVCGRNRLENEGATALAQTFEKLGTLEEVSLYQNGINASGISALARSFTTNTSLRYVDLNDNTFTAEGGKAMAQVLPRLSVLEFLNFDDCLIRDAGVDAIAEVFEEHCARLREVHFAFNEVSVGPGARLFKALAKKPSINYVNLNGNEFGEDGVTQLTTMAESLDCADALQSMSDDEGGDEDDDDVGDEDGEDDDTSASELQEVDTSGVVTSPDSSKASLSAISDCASPRRNEDDLVNQIASISLTQTQAE